MMLGTGYSRVATDVTCVLTRFELRSPFALLRFYYLFRRVHKEATFKAKGLIASEFLVQGMRTCYTLSLWNDARSILQFNTHVRSHVQAANFCFRDLKVHESGPALWSAQFQLTAVSPHNLRWRDIDFSALKMSRMDQPSHTASDVERI
jgi:hypothetical protein